MSDYLFDAKWKLTVLRSSIIDCDHCGKPESQHSDGHCLFEASIYRVSRMRDFLEDLMKNGGRLQIATRNFLLVQDLTSNEYEVTATNFIGSILTSGPAVLDKKST